MNDRIFVNAVGADGIPINIAVKNGRITSIGQKRPTIEQTEVIDLEGYLVLPGFVDGLFTSTRALLETVGAPTSQSPVCGSAWLSRSANSLLRRPSSSARTR
jgi:cytosine/adenosine deaminase-related metal-dependent hydrolase